MSIAVDGSAASSGRRITRRRFLGLGGTGLAGAALLGSGALAGCGGGEQGGGGAGAHLHFRPRRFWGFADADRSLQRGAQGRDQCDVAD